MIRTAIISECGKYRYSLTRRWARLRNCKMLVFLMLNPSKADSHVDDPTIRRCIGFAKLHGYGGIIVVNLFAFRATKPTAITTLAQLGKVCDAIGPDNDKHLFAAVRQADQIICAWGPNVARHPLMQRRADAVQMVMHYKELNMRCLARTKHGHPGHPLMLSYDRPFLPYP